VEKKAIMSSMLLKKKKKVEKDKRLSEALFICCEPNSE